MSLDGSTTVDAEQGRAVQIAAPTAKAAMADRTVRRWRIAALPFPNEGGPSQDQAQAYPSSWSSRARSLPDLSDLSPIRPRSEAVGVWLLDIAAAVIERLPAQCPIWPNPAVTG